MNQNANSQSKISFTEKDKYRELLERSGYNPDALGLVEILKNMHDQALSQGLAARAFRKWQLQQKVTAEGKEEKNA